MKIACIGWGSLIWKPGNLKLQTDWFTDGPFLPVEFSRISNNDRVTLIIDTDAVPVRTLWALTIETDLKSAVQNLMDREEIQNENLIHFAKASEDYNDTIRATVKNWVIHKELDAAIWTGLSFNRRKTQTKPSVEYILQHLRSLSPSDLQEAENYIRKAPNQIVTAYRKQFEKEFGWLPIE